MAELFRKKSPKAKIAKSTNGTPVEKAHAEAGAHKVGLRGGKKWSMPHYIAGVWLPSLFIRRKGKEVVPEFPEIPKGKIGVTWIGHASFLPAIPGAQSAGGSELGGVAEGDQAAEAAGDQDQPFAGHRPRAGDARAFRSPRSAVAAQGGGGAADRRAV